MFKKCDTRRPTVLNISSLNVLMGFNFNCNATIETPFTVGFARSDPQARIILSSGCTLLTISPAIAGTLLGTCFSQVRVQK
jgi:hypothetical protein